MVSLAHKDDYYETPPWLFKYIIKQTGLDLKDGTDVCATEETSKCNSYITKEMDALIHEYSCTEPILWCNPPRSLNGKFVKTMINVWEKYNYDIVMLLCWNDLGNKYGEPLLPYILSGNFIVGNLGKVKFYKDGKETQYVSRLTYFWMWMKKR